MLVARDEGTLTSLSDHDRKCVVPLQVLSEQCRRLGIDIEASSAHIAALSEARGIARKKPAWNLDISSIHRRIKEDMRSSQRPKTGTGDPPPYNGDSSLPPGWEVTLLL